MEEDGKAFTEPQGERRRYPRLQCSAEVRFRDLYKPHEKFSGSVAQDLSAGGLRVVAARFLPQGTRLVALVSLPGVAPQEVRAICRVAWVREARSLAGCGFGLEFIEINPQDRERLAGCVERGLVLR